MLTPEERTERKRQYQQAYYQANRDKIIQQTRAYRLAHIDEVTQHSRAYNRAHRAEISARNRRYRAKNREKLITASRQYYADNQERLTQYKRNRYAALHVEMRLYQNLYRLLNRDHINAKHRAWCDRNRQHVRDTAKRLRPRYRLRIRAWHRAYYQRYRLTNRHKLIAKEYRRRARLARAKRNDFTAEQRQLVLTTGKGVCPYCVYYNPGCKTCKRRGHTLTTDHITAVEKQGDNTLWNMVACCKSCNSKKWTHANPVPVQPLLL